MGCRDQKKNHSCSIAVLRVCVLVVTPSALKSCIFCVFILLPDSGLQGLAPSYSTWGGVTTCVLSQVQLLILNKSIKRVKFIEENRKDFFNMPIFWRKNKGLEDPSWVCLLILKWYSSLNGALMMCTLKKSQQGVVPHTIDSSVIVWISVSSCNVLQQVVRTVSLPKEKFPLWLASFLSPSMRFLEKFPFLWGPLIHWFESLRISFISASPLHYSLFLISKVLYFYFPFCVLGKNRIRSLNLGEQHIKNWLISSYFQDQCPV